MKTSSSILLALAALFLVACGSGTPVGEGCTESGDCVADASCFNDGTGVARCMALCDTDTRICSGGEVCLDSDSGDERVCFFGGNTEVGMPCTGGLECVTGAVCINDGTATLCRRACDTRDGTGCESGETCAETTAGGNAGFCQ